MHPEPVSAARQPGATATPPGPLRHGNRRGQPNLAPRCGAKARRTGCACRAPAMANGRCRMHGGASTGARTEAGLRRLAAVNTTHGQFAAGAVGAEDLRIRTILRRKRLALAADFLRAFLPPELAAQLETWAGPAALRMPRYGEAAPVAGKPACTSGRDARGRFAAKPRPGLRGRAAAREAARVEAAALAPWREAVVAARQAKRAARVAARGGLRNDLMHREPGVGAGGEARSGAADNPAGQCDAARRQPLHPDAVAAAWADGGADAGAAPAGQSAAARTGRGDSRNDLMHREPGVAAGGEARSGAADNPAGQCDAARRQPLHPDTVAGVWADGGADAGAAPAGQPAAARAGRGDSRNDLMHREPGVAAGGEARAGAADYPAGRCDTARRQPLHPDAVAAGGSPFRRSLMDTAVDGTLAWRAAQAGGWAVMAAGAKASAAGEDWQPAAWAARRDTLAATARRFARFMGRTVGWTLETLRWEGLAGEGCGGAFVRRDRGYGP